MLENDWSYVPFKVSCGPPDVAGVQLTLLISSNCPGVQVECLLARPGDGTV